MNMNTQLRRQILFVLDKINKELFLEHDNIDIVKYSLTVYPIASNGIDTVTEQRIVDLLCKEDIIEDILNKDEFIIGDNPNGNPKRAGLWLTIKLNRQKLLKYYAAIKNSQEMNSEPRLSIFKDGQISFTSSEGNTYKTKLSTKSNAYNALLIMATSPGEIFPFEKLASKFKRRNEFAIERQVRDAVGAIKKAIKYSGDELFKSDQGYGLACNVEIRI